MAELNTEELLNPILFNSCQTKTHERPITQHGRGPTYAYYEHSYTKWSKHTIFKIFQSFSKKIDQHDIKVRNWDKCR